MEGRVGLGWIGVGAGGHQKKKKKRLKGCVGGQIIENGKLAET